MKKKNLNNILILVAVILINLLATKFYLRWDLTADKRYSLSNTTKNLLRNLDDNLMIKVYLKGDFPLDFKRLQKETEQHLEELQTHTNKLHYQFINPTRKEEVLIKKGLQPSRLNTEENGVFSESIIFPWAIVSYKNKTANVPLLLNTQENQEKQLNQSIENLEFAFSKAIAAVSQKKTKTIAILKGNGELEDLYLFDFLSSLKDKYNLAPFVLPKEADNPQKDLEDLKAYDLVIIAKPTQAFSETQKFILDQYITNGGKSLWMIDNVIAEMDSLQQNGEALFVPRELNLTDLLFSYGIRINYNLVTDLYSSKIAIATGNRGNQTEFQQFLWHYYPLIKPEASHPISKNINRVILKYPSNIDTLKNNIHKEVLLQSSPLTKLIGLPNIVKLSSIADKVSPEKYNTKPQITGVLLKGEFTSAYQHRTKSFKTNFLAKSSPNKMIVISDGDIVTNQIHDGKPTRMDVDKWTGQYFGNKTFLLNAVDYLLDDTGLIELRGKTLDIKMLNKEKVFNEKNFWQFINIVLPLLLLGIFGIGYIYYLKRKYT